MTPLEELLVKCEFDRSYLVGYLLTQLYEAGLPADHAYVDMIERPSLDLCEHQHARLMPIIKALAEVIKVQREALEFECGNRCARGLNECSARECLAKAEEILKGLR